KDVFSAPFHKKREATAQKKKLAKDSDSDLIALVFAYQGWRSFVDARARREYCFEHYLSSVALEEVHGLRSLFRGQLKAANFATDEEPPRHNTFSLALLKSLLCAGLYPQVARTVSDTTAGGASRLLLRDGSRWWCHPGSVNFERFSKGSSSKYVVFSKRLCTSKPYLMDTSLVSPLPLILFGGSLARSFDNSKMVLDGWLGFRTTANAHVAVVALRKEIDAVFRRAV
ncbi:hypothetical protein M885DRAFT_423031, partial [Pelagophyceae sp. CCMP2097]